MMCDIYFSMQVDESTLPGSKYLIIVCMRLIKNDTVYEELAFSDLMEMIAQNVLYLKKS